MTIGNGRRRWVTLNPVPHARAAEHVLLDGAPERKEILLSTLQKSLVIFVDETDMWQDAHISAAITLERQGIAGATVNLGLMGYGRHRRIHRTGLFGMSDDRPVTIIAVDTDEKIRAVLLIIAPIRWSAKAQPPARR